MRGRLVLVSVIVGLISASALAQNEDTLKLQLPPAAQCDGNYAIVRISELVPGGSVGEFLKVVEAHKAWYRSHGFMNNEIYAAKIFVQDEATKVHTLSNTEIMTLHVRPPSEVKIDAEWVAFVKRYEDIAHVKSAYFVCLPKYH